MMETNPFELLRQIAGGYAVSRAVHVLAELNVADALNDTARSAADLARATGGEPDALHRILRLTAGHGVFALDGDQCTHTEASRMLRSDHPQSMRSFVRMFGLQVNWDAYGALEHAVRTGRPAMEQTLPEGFWRYLEQHPDANSIFNETMIAKARGHVPILAASYDFARFRLIADIGGGRGHLLRAILATTPQAKGILFDQPHVVQEAAALASDRLSLVGGDFFVDPLPKCDAYILMEVIHDWRDDDALRILRAVRQAATPGTTLLLIEELVREGAGADWPKLLDIHMMTFFAAKQRTLPEYQQLMCTAGFTFQRVIDTPAGISILEATVV